MDETLVIPIDKYPDKKLSMGENDMEGCQ